MWSIPNQIFRTVPCHQLINVFASILVPAYYKFAPCWRHTHTSLPSDAPSVQLQFAPHSWHFTAKKRRHPNSTSSAGNSWAIVKVSRISEWKTRERPFCCFKMGWSLCGWFTINQDFDSLPVSRRFGCNGLFSAHIQWMNGCLENGLHQLERSHLGSEGKILLNCTGIYLFKNILPGTVMVIGTIR